MTLKLEVGKSYRRSDGVKCTVDFDDESSWARFRSIGEAAPRVLWYHPDGRSVLDKKYNLIAEWEEPLSHGHARLPCGKVVDLTNPHGTAFGLLDEVYGKGTQEAMQKHGGPYEYFSQSWVPTPSAIWFKGGAYRVAPKREPRTWWIVGGWGAFEDEQEARENAKGLEVVKVVEVME